MEYEQVTDFCHLNALYHSYIIFCLLKEQFNSLQKSSSSSPKAVCITNAKGCCMSIIHTVNIIFVRLNLLHSSLSLPVSNFPTWTCRMTSCRFSFACSRELFQSLGSFYPHVRCSTKVSLVSLWIHQNHIHVTSSINGSGFTRNSSWLRPWGHWEPFECSMLIKSWPCLRLSIFYHFCFKVLLCCF